MARADSMRMVKRGSTVLLAMFILGLILLPEVSAAVVPSFLTDLMTQIFNGVPGNNVAMRSIIGLLIFCVYYFASSYVFVDKNDPKKFGGIRVMVAIILAIITAIGVPYNFLLIIFGDSTGGGLYGSVAGIILIMVPLIGLAWIGFAIYKKQKGIFGKLILLVISAIMLTLLSVADLQVKKQSGNWTSALSDGLGIVSMVFVIIFFWMLFSFFGDLFKKFKGKGKSGSTTSTGTGEGRVRGGGSRKPPRTPGSSGRPNREILKDIEKELKNYRKEIINYHNAAGRILARRAASSSARRFFMRNGSLSKTIDEIFRISEALDDLFDECDFSTMTDEEWDMFTRRENIRTQYMLALGWVINEFVAKWTSGGTFPMTTPRPTGATNPWDPTPVV